MSLRDLLEEFSANPMSDDQAEQLERLEAAQAAGYEAGYKSGWDDAVAAERKVRGQVDAEFERCIQDLGFTYHEAIDQVRSELATFLVELVEALFPAVVPDLLRETVHAEAIDLAEGHLNPTVKLLASETVVSQLQDMVPDTSLDISVEAEESLAPNQAFLTLAGQERVIDFQPLIDTLRQQLGAMTQSPRTEFSDDG